MKETFQIRCVGGNKTIGSGSSVGLPKSKGHANENVREYADKGQSVTEQKTKHIKIDE